MSALATRAALLTAPIPLSELESILEWVDNFKLSRSTKKIYRDFSDAVLLAEILFLYYPKLVEMHNYPPRNSAALKLNNWMTLNRKVLKKLKLSLCTETMELLANSTPGVIERILLMVRDKIRKDEEANKSMNDDQEVSSGGSYYEACGDEENVLIVPVKTRVNGVLELVQQKVVTYNAYVVLKEELKDAKEAIDVLKQKVQHLDQLMKLKEERIDELQNQLERKALRRKESETSQNSSISPNNSQTVSQKTSEVTVFFALNKNEIAANKSKDNIINAVKDASKSKDNLINTIIDIEARHSNTSNDINKELPPNFSDYKIEIIDKEKSITDLQDKEKSHTVKDKVNSLSNIMDKDKSETNIKYKEKSKTDINNGEKSLTDIKEKTKSITDLKDKVVLNEIFNTDIKEKFNVSKVYEDVIKVAKSSTSQNAELKSSDEDFRDSMQELTIEQSVYKEVIEISNLAR